MERTLQKRFVIASMTAVTCLLVILLGIFNWVHWWMLDQQCQESLADLTQRLQSQPQGPEPTAGKGNGWNPFQPRIDDDIRQSTRFFQVTLAADGTVLQVDVSQISSVTQEEAAAYGSAVGETDQGKTDHFWYQVIEDKDGTSRDAIFLDVSNEQRSMVTVLILSAGVTGLCWLGTLLLVLLLSRRAIRPVAQNMEKQKQFVTNAGHEIKTPLAIIQANAEAMELCQGENKWTRNIRAQTVRLTGLMENLLTLARMQEGTQNLIPQRVDLSALALEAAEGFREGAALRSLTLETAVTPGLTIQADRSQLGQLLTVLLDNGVKYTEGEGKITLSVYQKEGKVFLQVANTPAHLPEEDPERLFERFYRGDPARNQKTGGCGIGLSAAKAIAENWQGVISARQDGADQVVFTVRFPGSGDSKS